MESAGESVVEPARQTCVNHPASESGGPCALCGSAICETCAFDFSGNRVCPACVMAGEGDEEGSHGSKKLLITAYVLAAVASVSFITLFLTEQHWSEEVFGCFFVLLLPTAIAGLVFCFSVRRSARRTAAEWVALLWNAAILGSMALLIIIGAVMGA